MTLAPNGAPRQKITAATLKDKKRSREPITCLTAYDYATARLLDEASIDILLVGDSLAMTMLGYENTLSVTVDEMLHHAKAVRRAVRTALLVVDMPYGSYHLGADDAVRHAVRFMKEANAEAVKIEGGENRADTIRRVIDAEVPVCGHIGLTPQSVHRMGGYKVQGTMLADIEQLTRDALALEGAGVAAIFLEAIPREVAAMITAEVSVPTIGIGAGPDCDGQVLVIHDLLNLSFAPPAKFVRRYADTAAEITRAVAAYRADVLARAYPSDIESYHLSSETRQALESFLERKNTLRR
ncbi:MAG: 3-methyl-2-oxobutanoate hydroxymethyltransferase [Candidatus Acidiferrales bacterium]